ncbi:MAG: sulfatase [Lachnospiraceae bacterium]|nr:sulfatase [Lachnospiraceae bacterium]
MKAIMVMYDSLNREMLEPYGCDWVKTPNFKRLAEKCVQFEQCYVCSMPCMPARRELHTGRSNFLHRSWGPMEPYDDSMPEILKKGGIYTHLVSDHQHYWEDGGATYHNRYSSWEISRGQEGDNWKADLTYQYQPKGTVFEYKKVMLEYPLYARMMAQDQINRSNMDTEEKTSQAVTFSQGLDFIERNHAEDNWFLQIETFDPHEPFYTLPKDKELYPHHFTGDAEMEADWPPYAPAVEDENTKQHVRYNYAALVSKCDRYLGKVLDAMDRYGLWEDTMLIVNTDHGFLLGEHGWWGKTSMPIFNEIAHIPLFIYDPRKKELAGSKRNAIVQTVDIAPTLLEYFGMDIPKDMQGKPLSQVMDYDAPIRQYAVYGYHGSQIDVTDGRYVYMHAAEHPEEPVYEYTLMPTHMRQMFSPQELQEMELAEPFFFTKGCRLMKIKKADMMGDTTAFGSALYDLEQDPSQNTPIQDDVVICRMKGYIREYMEQNDAPKELYHRLGL